MDGPYVTCRYSKQPNGQQTTLRISITQKLPLIGIQIIQAMRLSPNQLQPGSQEFTVGIVLTYWFAAFQHIDRRKVYRNSSKLYPTSRMDIMMSLHKKGVVECWRAHTHLDVTSILQVGQSLVLNALLPHCF